MKTHHLDLTRPTEDKGPLKIVKTQVLDGANYYSANPAIVMKLQGSDTVQMAALAGDEFREKLLKIIPSLEQHPCKQDEEATFLLEGKSVVYAEHLAGHIATELQVLAGLQVDAKSFCKHFENNKRLAVYPFLEEQTGLYAGEAAVSILNTLLNGVDTDADICTGHLTYLRQKHMPGPGKQAIIDEAQQRGIPVMHLPNYKLTQLGTGMFQKRLRNTLSPYAGFLAVGNVKDSWLSTQMMGNAGIPVAKSILTQSKEEALKFKKKVNKPIVIKSPCNERKRNVFPVLTRKNDIERAFLLCQTQAEKVFVQEHIPGFTYRLLVINNRFEAATLLEKPEVTANGKDTIAMLLEKLNQDQNRVSDNKGCLSVLEASDVMLETLSFYGYTLESIPDKGVKVVFSHHSSPRQGAFTTDVTDEVHPLNAFLAERATEIAGLDVAGVTIICPDISKPITSELGAVINVLAGPDLRMHVNPWKGKPRDVASAFTSMLFPEKSLSRVPLFSVTGSKGKTACAALIQFMLQKEGYKTGMAVSTGLYIGNRKILDGNMAHKQAARQLLKDPGIDSAVLETSAISILQHGLGYDFADFGIVLNIDKKQLELKDHEDTFNTARIKSVVSRKVYREGMSILNADDQQVLQMAEKAGGQVALFTTRSENSAFKKHILKGGWGAITENNTLYLWNTSGKTAVAPLDTIPLWEEKKNKIMLQAIMAATLAMASFDFTTDRIGHLLKAFKPYENP